MRVIAGLARGRRLRVPRSPRIRPTSDRVKEAVFGSLHLQLPGSVFLDLCAGTGAMGIEALSRGAARAVFVEIDPRLARIIEENLATCGLAEKAEVILGDALGVLESLAASGRPFDFIYVDPPYDSGLAEAVAQFVDAHAEVLAPEGRILFEHRSKDIGSEGLNRLRVDKAKHFGDRWVLFYAPKEGLRDL